MQKVIAVVILVFCFTLHSNSQIITDTAHLDVVLVTTKSNQKNINTARSVDVIDVAKICPNIANSLHNLLNTSSGVYMVDMGNEQHAMSIRLPINYSPLYSYLENGIPLRPVGIFNNNELLELNRFFIHKIEIAKGTYSSNYGAQSIGASINFIQNNFTNSSNEVLLQSNGYGQLETCVQYKWKIKSSKFLINLNHAQRNVDDYLHYNYSKQAISCSYEYDINKRNTICFQSHLINYNGDQRDGYDSANFYGANYSSYDRFSDRKTWAIRNSLQWKHDFSEKHFLHITAFNRILNETQNPFYLISYVPPYTGQITTDKFASYGINVNHSITNKKEKWQFNQSVYIDFTPNNHYTSQYILVNKINGVNDNYLTTDSLLTNYNANLKSIALSTSANYYATKKLVFYASLRTDGLYYTFNNNLNSTAYSGAPSGKNQFTNFSPEASVLYKITNNKSIYVQYSNGYTPPTLSIMYRAVKTPTLTAAKYSNYELGYKSSYKHFNLQLTAYYMKGIDEFISVITPTGVEVVNAGKTSHKGIELKFQYFNKTFDVNFNASISQHIFAKYQVVDWSNNVKVYDGNKMNGAPSYLHYTSVGYVFTKKRIAKLIADWNIVGPYKIDAENKFDYNGYQVFNLKLNINIKKCFFNIGVNNILNTIYATNADGNYGIRYYPGLPRTLQVGVNYKW